VKPTFVPYFDHLTFLKKIFITNKQSIENKIIHIDRTTKLLTISLDMKNTKIINIENNNIINSEFFENIFYNKKYDDIYKIFEIIKADLINFDTFHFNLASKAINTHIPNKISTTREITMVDMSLLKFKQRIITPNIYQSIICDWFVKEYDKYNTLEYYVKIDELKNIFLFCIESFTSILDIITKYYCLDDTTINYNIVDTFIVKNTQNSANNDYDNNYDMVATILLNDEYDGGGFYFDDEITSFLEKGSMIVHNSNVNHSITQITRGSQYLLKIYIKIIKVN